MPDLEQPVELWQNSSHWTLLLCQPLLWIQLEQKHPSKDTRNWRIDTNIWCYILVVNVSKSPSSGGFMTLSRLFFNVFIIMWYCSFFFLRSPYCWQWHRTKQYVQLWYAQALSGLKELCLSSFFGDVMAALSSSEPAHVLRKPPNTVQYLDHYTIDCLQSRYLLFSSHLPPRKLSDAGPLMFMRSTCQSRGELSGSGSVNWALIRCCSN